MAFALRSCVEFSMGCRSFTNALFSFVSTFTGNEFSASGRSVVLVISVGNLTVGGTGKTPIVEKFARALQTGGRRVAILSRGYKSVPRKRSWLDRLRRSMVEPPRIVSDGKSLLLDSRTAGDEPYMLAHNLKDVVVLVDKDRVKSGLLAIDKWKVDTLLLDDGLQYLHLKHRLDIVLVDRQAPFGNEFLLPRGTLREAPRNLRRASYIFITKSTGESNEALIKRIRRYNRTAEIIECAHKPLYLQNVFTGERLPLERLRDAFIGSICGIAAPESFEGALKKLGAHVDLAKRYIDHHYYTEAELTTFINRCIRRDLAMIVTTEKDAVRMPHLPEAGSEGSDLFFARRNRNPERSRKLGTLRRSHLQTAAHAIARAFFRLIVCHSERSRGISNYHAE